MAASLTLNWVMYGVRPAAVNVAESVITIAFPLASKSMPTIRNGSRLLSCATVTVSPTCIPAVEARWSLITASPGFWYQRPLTSSRLVQDRSPVVVSTIG